jgi:hypothetical protein
MEELRQALHAAASDPPPTGIDLDHIIAGTRRQSRLQQRVGLVAGLTLAAGAAILVPAALTAPSGGLGAGGPGGVTGTCAPYSPGPGTPWPTVVPNPVIPESSRGPAPDPSGPPYPPVVCGGATKACPELAPTSAPRPSRPAEELAGAREPCGDAVPRLSSALAVAMGSALPGWGVTDSVDGGNPSTQWVFLRTAADATSDGYVAQLGLAKNGQISSLTVRITVAAPGEAGRGCAGQHLKDGATCRVTADGHVLVTAVQSLQNLPGSTSSPPSIPTWLTVTDISPDGTKVEVTGRSPVTKGQLEALAQDPGLTLFP